MAKAKLSAANKAAAKLAAEEKAALEFSRGWEHGVAGEHAATEDGLVYEAGYFAGFKERGRRAREEAKRQ